MDGQRIGTRRTTPTLSLNSGKMGLRIQYIKYGNRFIKSEFKRHKGLSMLELGNQTIRRSSKHDLPKTGKKYFESLGMHHTSVDLNGLDGAIALNLSKPIINPNWVNHFDVVTNFGTTEHVEPYEAQYACFRNIHNFMAVNGLFDDVDLMYTMEHGNKVSYKTIEEVLRKHFN